MILKIILAILLATSVHASPLLVNNPTEMVQDEMDIKIHAARTIVAIYTNNNPEASKMFEETVAHWNMYYRDHKHFDMNTLLKAISFAAIKFNGQHRNDAENTPYIVYSMGVARLLFDEGRVTNVNVLTAAMLQNVLQYSNTQPDEIEYLFSERVLATIQELTTNSSDEEVTQLSLNSQLIKLADRLYTIRDLSQTDLPVEYIYAYKVWGQQLLNSLRGTNPDLEVALQKEILT